MDKVIPWARLSKLIKPHYPKAGNGRQPMGLERRDLTGKLFEAIGGYLEEKGLLLREGTIVDATLIAAPTSTRNKERKRDP